MIYLEIGPNEEGQRLDRFLRKYLASASLSAIYKIIRKDIKVNGKRKTENYQLRLGDELALYVSDEDIKKYQAKPERQRSKRQFEIVYEDENLLIVNKPFGLLTHGDAKEKKNHLSNQVLDYLIEEGKYNPRLEKTFSPAPANRLDRNTTGLVIFGKNAKALRELNKLVRGDNEGGKGIGKYYLTIVVGEVKKPLDLQGEMVKDGKDNKVRILKSEGEVGKGKIMRTLARPLETVVFNGASGKPGKLTLMEVEILTGRTHQIRAQLFEAGYPLIGDPKYGDSSANRACKAKLGLNTQLLHAWKLTFNVDEDSPLAYLNGREVEAKLPDNFMEIKNALGFSL